MCYTPGMRTTVELADEHRAKLLELAARRGEKGFSRIIAEAVSAYLEQLHEREETRTRALALRGALPKGDADQLRRHTATLRESWR